MTALTVKMKPRLLLTKCRTIHSHIYKQAAGCLSYLPRAANAKHMKQKQPIQYSMHCDLGIINGTPWFENFKLLMPPFTILLNPQKLEKQQNRKSSLFPTKGFVKHQKVNTKKDLKNR